MTRSPTATLAAFTVGGTLLMLAVSACSRPAAATGEEQQQALPFTEVQHDLFAMPNSYANSWGDFDNDGDLDLAVSLATGEVRLYRNDQGVFESVGPQMGMPQAGGQQLRGVGWGDYDGDGFIDLIGGAFVADQVSVVLHNEGGTHFTDVAPALGLTIPGRSSRPTNWVDFDNDGHLDVYATNRTGPNALFRNAGERFTRVAGGPEDPRPTVGACWFDMDNDGDLDVFLANQAGTADAVWRNDGSTFTDVAATLGMEGPERTTAEGGVGCAIGDYDNDGNLDLFVANYGHNQLYRNHGDGTFTEVAQTVGIDVENHAVSADWGDYDNDGDLDLFVASYVGSTPDQQPANALFSNDGSRPLHGHPPEAERAQRRRSLRAARGLRPRRRAGPLPDGRVRPRRRSPPVSKHPPRRDEAAESERAGARRRRPSHALRRRDPPVRRLGAHPGRQAGGHRRRLQRADGGARALRPEVHGARARRGDVHGPRGPQDADGGRRRPGRLPRHGPRDPGIALS